MDHIGVSDAPYQALGTRDWYSGRREPIEESVSEKDDEDTPRYDEKDDSWQARAFRALSIHNQVKDSLWKRQTWTKCLRFPDPEYEMAFQWYFAQMRSAKMQGTLLLMSVCYTIFALVNWGGDWAYMFPPRLVYLLCLSGGFAGTFTTFYKNNIQGYSSALSILTGMEIIVEAAVGKQMFNPAIVMVLILYLLFGTIVVGLMMGQVTTICITVLLLYDFVAVIFYRNGDAWAAKGNVAKYMVLYNLVLVVVVGISVVLSRRMEISRRQEFLITYRIERERRLQTGSGPGPLELLLREADTQPDLGADDDIQQDSSDSAATRPSFSSAVSKQASHRDVKVDEVKDSDTDEDEKGEKQERRVHFDEEGTDEEEGFVLDQKEKVISPTGDSKDSGSKKKRRKDKSPLSPPSGPASPTGLRSPISEGGTSPRESTGSPSLPPTSPSFAPFLDNLLSEPGDKIISFLKKIETLASHSDQYDISKIVAESGAANIRAFLRKEEKREARHEHEYKETFQLSNNNELPDYFCDYPYILTAYRVHFSPNLCLKSILMLHNETMNIWTEFVPFLIFFFGSLWYLATSTTYIKASYGDKVIVTIGLIGSLVIRPLCSGLAHAFFCSSRRHYVFWWGVDYASICVSVLCASLVFGRFAFYCFGQQQLFYYFSVSGLFCSTILSVLFVASAAVRAGSFTLFVVFANALPFIFQLTLKWGGNADNDVNTDYFSYWLSALALLGLGLTVKSTMVPERCHPGRYDIWGSSHQWWHLLINIGHVMQVVSWQTYLTWRINVPCSNSL